jgi:N-acyl-D-aspartate/D-glutamate deacylase
VAWQVRRLTSDPAEFIGVDAGTMAVGDRADLTIIDPDALAAYDSEANSRFIWRDDYQHEQMVNRSDGVVSAVFVGGEQVWDGQRFTEVAGQRTLGRALRHTSWAPDRARPAMAAE